MQNLSWLPALVWTDYRVALIFTVLAPLVLLVWALATKAESMQRLLAIYWRVASLLAITIYLLIAALPIGFLTGWFARILIPISLWFWVDLNEEIVDQPQARLRFAFTSWRWAVSIYSVLGALAQIPVLGCALKSSAAVVNDPVCRLWLEPAWGFKAFFHGATRPYFLGFLALLALAVYILYLGYFVLVKLGKQGRSATGQ